MPRRSWANKGCANHTMQTFISKSKPWIKTSTRKERDVTGKLRLFASTSAVCSDRTLSKPNAIRQLSKLVFSYKITQHRRDVEQAEEGTWRNVRARVFWGFSRDRITCKKKKKKISMQSCCFDTVCVAVGRLLLDLARVSTCGPDGARWQLLSSYVWAPVAVREAHICSSVKGARGGLMHVTDATCSQRKHRVDCHSAGH